MDDSETLTIFIGHRCSDQLIQKLFGYVNVISMPELIVSILSINYFCVNSILTQMRIMLHFY